MPRQIPAYDELQIRLTPDRAGAYHVEIRSAADASGHGSFRPPSEVELEAFRLTVDPARSRVRGQRSRKLEKAKEFGDELFHALVSDESVREVFVTARHDAESAGRGLRVTLFLSAAPELAAIPWEFLYRRPRFLAQSVSTPVVRYLDLEHTHPPLAVDPPLRILGMISRPKDDELADLDFEREQANLERALAPLIETHRVELRWLPNATLRELQREVAHGDDFHVFHYIGHGEYDERSGDGFLVLERPDGRTHFVTGEQLGGLLCDRHMLRLAILNACEGASTSPHDALAGVAAALVEYEVPAVVGMQFAITDDAAITFAEELYATLADGYPIDAAVTEARRALSAESDVEWATPVLFMRVPDGRVFDLAATAAVEVDEHDDVQGGQPPRAPPDGAPPKPKPERRRPDSQRLRRPRMLAAAAVAVVAVMAAIGTAVWRGGDSGTVQGGPTWRLVATLPGPGRQVAFRIAAVRDGFIAVGIRAGNDDLDAAVWSSRDGSLWKPIVDPKGSFGGPGDQTMGGILALPGTGAPSQVLLSGHDGRSSKDEPSVWIGSQKSWREEIAQSPVDGAGAMHRAEVVSVGGNLVVGVGYTQPTGGVRQPGAWLRHGAGAWTQMSPDPTLSSGEGGELHGIARFGGQLVAVGELDRRAEAWTFTGTGWIPNPISHPTDLPDPGDGVVANDVIAHHGRLIAVGSERIGAKRHAAVWLTDDNVDWSTADVPPGLGGDQEMSSVAAAGSQLIAVGYRGTSTPQATVWTSGDGGQTWSDARTNSVQRPSGTASTINSVAVGHGTVLAAGRTSRGGTGFDYAIWQLVAPSEK